MTSTTLKSLALCCLLPLSAHAQEAIDESRVVSSNEHVSIEILSGDVTIRGAQDNVFRVRGTLAEDAEGFTLNSDNGFTRFEVNMPRRGLFNWSSNGNDESNLEIELPIGSTVEFEGVSIDINIHNINGGSDISTVNGDIDASDLSTVVSLSTVNGSIRSNGASGRVEMATVSGEISDRESEGRIEYTTVSGDIVGHSRAQEVNVETVSGEAELDLVGTQVIEMNTVSGDIEIRLAQSLSPRVEGSSVSGGLYLAVEPQVSARISIDAHSGGDIDNNLSNERPTKDKYGPSRHLKFSKGDGLGAINLTTVSGEIELDEL